MASGVQLSDDVVRLFNDIKVRKTGNQEVNRKKAAFFRLSDDLKFIIVDEAKEVLTSDIGVTGEDPFDKFTSLLPCNECRYALYDASFETADGKKEELIFVFWAPAEAPLKQKMIYASSKDAIKKKFTGIKHEWQVNERCDLNQCELAGKLRLSGGARVVSLEGKPF